MLTCIIKCLTHLSYQNPFKMHRYLWYVGTLSKMSQNNHLVSEGYVFCHNKELCHVFLCKIKSTSKNLDKNLKKKKNLSERGQPGKFVHKGDIISGLRN